MQLNIPYNTLHHEKLTLFDQINSIDSIPCPAQAGWPPAITADGP